LTISAMVFHSSRCDPRRLSRSFLVDCCLASWSLPAGDRFNSCGSCRRCDSAALVLCVLRDEYVTKFSSVNLLAATMALSPRKDRPGWRDRQHP
jgi:hypothetical protein